MAKVKQKLGIFFWVLVGVFVLSTAGGVYYFFFIPKNVDLNDPLLEDMNITQTDTTHQNNTLYEAPIPTDSVNTDSQKVITQDKPADVKKEETPVEKNVPVTKTQDKPKTNNTQKTINIKPEQKTVQTTTTGKNLTSTGNIRIVDNPKESKIGNSHIYESNGAYSVQVSSWRKKTQARKEALRLQSQGLNVFIVKVYLRSLGSTWYRVRVGDFATLNEAREFEKNKK